MELLSRKETIIIVIVGLTATNAIAAWYANGVLLITSSLTCLAMSVFA